MTPDPEFVQKVSLRFAREHRALGVVLPDGRREVAVASGNSRAVLDILSCFLKRRVVAHECEAGTLDELIARAYHESARTVEEVSRDFSPEEAPLEELAKEDVLDSEGRSPAVRLVNSMLLQAVKMRASDIHLQPAEADVRVRFRVDGVLYDIAQLPKRLQDALVSRMKVLARMDIAEKRLPQDGGLSFRIGGREIDVRASVIPTRFGERVVFRLQDRSLGVFRLDSLGLSPGDLSTLQRLIRLSHGIVFVTGPTGSGKTTTLYACLDAINTPGHNIVTIEDPIEYHLEGISQTEVSEKKGLTFATGLRSIVRQDPDVIMVGEVRDLETARIAIQSAMTGHLVFSTLHTNDAPGAITRLLDLGAESFLVASSLVASIAQRLVRKVCRGCAEEQELPKEELEVLGFSPEEVEGGRLMRGRHCEECLNTGYLGRTGIFETLVVNDEIRSLIVKRATSSEIRRAALKAGMRPLREAGLEKVRQGLTTLQELRRQTQADVD